MQHIVKFTTWAGHGQSQPVIHRPFGSGNGRRSPVRLFRMLKAKWGKIATDDSILSVICLLLWMLTVNHMTAGNTRILVVHLLFGIGLFNHTPFIALIKSLWSDVLLWVNKKQQWREQLWQWVKKQTDRGLVISLSGCAGSLLSFFPLALLDWAALSWMGLYWLVVDSRRGYKTWA